MTAYYATHSRLHILILSHINTYAIVSRFNILKRKQVLQIFAILNVRTSPNGEKILSTLAVKAFEG